MSKKSRRKFSLEQKRKAVRGYVSGERRATDIANELGISVQLLYSWKVYLDENKRNEALAELEARGLSSQAARIIQAKQEEIEAYQKKVAELTVINDLLKKLQTPKSLVQESELSGLIETSKKLDRKKGRSK